MKKAEKIFIGVAWPYVNGPLHIGHLAGAYLAADIFARYHRLKGNRVLMVSGSDMHGTPTLVEAEKGGIKPIDFADKYHQIDKKIFKRLGVTFDLYTKTSTKNHQKVAQDIFLTLLKKKYLSKAKSTQPYCPKCQRFLPDRFVEGECPHCHHQQARGDQCDACGRTLDPTELSSPYCKTCHSTPIFKETEHYYFDLPQFSNRLQAWLKKQKHWRKNVYETALGWVKEGLKPRAVTRDLDYGVPVPLKNFKDKVIYVWFEAVIGYLSASLEWAKKQGKIEAWKGLWQDPKCRHFYFMGKDNIVFHTIIWPAMLLGYNPKLNLPYNVVANQFLNIKGEKLSKSRGRFITVEELLNQYDIGAVRFYFTYNMPETRDADFSDESFVKQNNGILVGTIGNFINRSLSFIARFFAGQIKEDRIDPQVKKKIRETFNKTGRQIEQAHFQKAIREVIGLAEFGNLYFDQNKPWERVKEEQEEPERTLYNCAQICVALSTLLEPFFPYACPKLRKQLGIKKAPEWEFKEQKPIKLEKISPLFKKY